MQKKLTKSRTNRVLTGTLGGVAEFIGMDASIVRILYVIFSIISTAFPGVIVYVLLAAIIPEAKEKFSPFEEFANRVRPRKNARPVDDDEADHTDGEWSDF